MAHLREEVSDDEDVRALEFGYLILFERVGGRFYILKYCGNNRQSSRTWSKFFLTMVPSELDFLKQKPDVGEDPTSSLSGSHPLYLSLVHLTVITRTVIELLTERAWCRSQNPENAFHECF